MNNKRLNGISIYFHNSDIQKVKEIIILASKLNYRFVFSSLHLPEFEIENQLIYASELSKLTHQYHLDFVCDIRGSVLNTIYNNEKLNRLFKQIQIDVLRLDFEVTKKTIEVLNRLFIRKIQINSSILNQNELEIILEKCSDYNFSVEACHNFYPRKETGLDESYFIKQNDLMKRYNIRNMACLPSLTNPRGPIGEGLPTLEVHRLMSFDKAVWEMFLFYSIDEVLIADPFPSEAEMRYLQKISLERVCELKIERYTNNNVINDFLFKQVHTCRRDSGKYQWRLLDSRNMASTSKFKIEPDNNNKKRPCGSITIDNMFYNRYEGEVQILKHSLPPSNQVNLIGKVVESDLWKIQLLNEHVKVVFVDVKPDNL